MKNNKFFAVITGDLVKSKRLPNQNTVLSALNSAFNSVQLFLECKQNSNILCAPFQIFRGDSFQGVISNPELALHVLIILRASLRCIRHTQRRKNSIDVRLALGIGTVNYLPDKKVSEGDGDAFRRSGTLLDTLKKKPVFLAVDTPWPDINKELDVECALLDAIIYKWSAHQAEAILGYLRGLTQAEIGNNLGITQAALSLRLRDAGSKAIEICCNRYQNIIRDVSHC
ncbi:MAG: hypothetical protein JXB48_10845 [Candidatus Latescibacteria bacterium]|nr:hypothetical protein [Candidatus Latescibacterota bacterium]